MNKKRQEKKPQKDFEFSYNVGKCPGIMERCHFNLKHKDQFMPDETYKAGESESLNSLGSNADKKKDLNAGDERYTSPERNNSGNEYPEALEDEDFEDEDFEDEDFEDEDFADNIDFANKNDKDDGDEGDDADYDEDDGDDDENEQTDRTQNTKTAKAGDGNGTGTDGNKDA